MVFKDSADTAIPELAGVQRRAAIVGGAAAVVSTVGLLLNPTQFFQSYLMAYMWVLGATLGCLALGMIHQLSGGEWGVLIRRPIGAASRVLPVYSRSCTKTNTKRTVPMPISNALPLPAIQCSMQN